MSKPGNTIALTPNGTFQYPVNAGQFAEATKGVVLNNLSGYTLTARSSIKSTTIPPWFSDYIPTATNSDTIVITSSATQSHGYALTPEITSTVYSVADPDPVGYPVANTVQNDNFTIGTLAVGALATAFNIPQNVHSIKCVVDTSGGNINIQAVGVQTSFIYGAFNNLAPNSVIEFTYYGPIDQQISFSITTASGVPAGTVYITGSTDVANLVAQITTVPTNPPVVNIGNGLTNPQSPIAIPQRGGFYYLPTVLGRGNGTGEQGASGIFNNSSGTLVGGPPGGFLRRITGITYENVPAAAGSIEFHHGTSAAGPLLANPDIYSAGATVAPWSPGWETYNGLFIVWPVASAIRVTASYRDEPVG